MTKIVTLLGELRALKDEDKDARAIVFTARSVQKKIVKALATVGWEVFEFNKQTEPTRRHKHHQAVPGRPPDGRPKVCVATYATAAVGVTLTAPTASS